MDFLAPEMLWMSATLPLLLLLYVGRLRAKHRASRQYPGLLSIAGGRGSSWSHHLASVLIFAALACAVIACARPIASAPVLARQHTVILAVDVSPSMSAEDVYPNRLSAAQTAANAFVEALPRGVRVGVVAYGGVAVLVQAPTRDKNVLVNAIDLVQLQPGTAIGNGMLVALATLFPDRGIQVDQFKSVIAPQQRPMDPPMWTGPEQPVPMPGAYRGAEIVLLSDGQNTTGIDPLAAARVVAAYGVRVYTVGFGTASGERLKFGNWSTVVRLDEATLRRIAEATGGLYFGASTASELKRVFEKVQTQLQVERQKVEVTAVFAGIAALLLTFGCSLSVWRHARVL